MKKRIIQLFLVTISVILMISCIDENNSTGEISGYAYLCDTLGGFTNSAGITATIDNTNLQTQTDSLGHFTFTGVRKGIYSISFSKNGYAMDKLVNLQFLGKDEYGCEETAILIQFSSINSISNATVQSDPTSKYVTFVGSINSNSAYRTCRLFIGKNNSVSSSPDQYDYQARIELSTIFTFTNGNYTIFPQVANFTQDIDQSILVTLGYKPGQKVYAILYPECSASAYYLDTKTNKSVYTSLGTPSSVLSFTVPE